MNDVIEAGKLAADIIERASRMPPGPEKDAMLRTAQALRNFIGAVAHRLEGN